MDPFLEHPSFFPDLHGRLNVYLGEALQARLPEPYFAVINERLWVETDERFIEPDVDVLRGGGHSRRRGESEESLGQESSHKPIVITIPHEERRETFVEIRTKRRNRGERVITTIEFLSIANKTPGEKGRDLYLRKQREVLDGDINLVEIDLLRGGTHSTAVPRRRIERKAGPFDYHVSVHHFEMFDRCFVYPVKLEERLPEISIPLLPGDDAVPVDLQAVLNHCYKVGPYSRRVEYKMSELVPPVPAKQARWVRQRLREAKLVRG
jgi:hypothetical protein